MCPIKLWSIKPVGMLVSKYHTGAGSHTNVHLRFIRLSWLTSDRGIRDPWIRVAYLSLFPHLLSRTIYLSTTFAHGNVDTRTWWFLERSSNCIRQSCVSSRRDSGYNRKRFQDDYPEDFAGTGLHYSCLQARIYIGIVSTTAGIYTVVDLQSRLLEAFLSVAQPTIHRTFLVTVKILLRVAVESLSKFSR